MNQNIIMDGSKSTLYMNFSKSHRSAQGMTIWDDRMFIFYDTGVCSVYDLKSRNQESLASFKLDTYNPGIPNDDYKNHANSCMFSKLHYQGNPIPLLYITIGNGIGSDKDGFYYRCAVENITNNISEDGREEYQSKVLQIITYKPEGIEKVPYESPCWGCPSFLIDCDDGYLYIVSARYRTKRGCVPEGMKNAYIITKFKLPELPQNSDDFMTCLTPENILDQFIIDSDVLFTQGGTLYNKRIYYTFGLPRKDYPDIIMVIDLDEKKLISEIHNLDEAFEYGELECCEVYHDQLLCNTNDGKIFVVNNTEKII